MMDEEKNVHDTMTTKKKNQTRKQKMQWVQFGFKTLACIF